MVKSATLYKATNVVVNPLVGRRRAAGVAALEEVVHAQLASAEADGTFNCVEPTMNHLRYRNSLILLFPRFIVLPDTVKVLICPDGTARWKSTATRCDVFVDCRQQPGVLFSGASSPWRWGTWWALDGNDTKDTLTSLYHL